MSGLWLLVVAATAIACGTPLLKPDQPTEGELRPGQELTYQIDVEAGDFLHIAVDQYELDAVVRLFGPDGRMIGEPVDYFFNGEIEDIYYLVDQSGRHRIEIGQYSSQGEAHEPLGFRLSYSVEPGDATRRAKSNAFWSFVTGTNLAYEDTDCAAAIESLQEAERLATEAEAHELAVLAKTEIGVCEAKAGKMDSALEILSSALRIAEAGDSKLLEAKVLERTATYERRLGQLDQALEHSLAAADLFRQEQNLNGERRVLMTLCALHSSMGLLKEAESFCRQAIDLPEKGADLEGIANARSGLAWILRIQGRHEEARVELETALDLAAPGSFEEATASTSLAVIFSDAGHHSQAIPYFERAIRLFSDLERKRSLALSLDGLASSLLALDRVASARDTIERSIEIAQSLGQNVVVAQTLETRSRIRWKQGELDGATADIAHALDLIENTRPNAPDYRSRASFLAAKWRIYERRIVMWMRHPSVSQETLSAGLHAAEMARARTLVERISKRDLNLDSPVSRILSPEEIQASILTEDTALLQFSLGSQESYLWTVTKDLVRAQLLPDRTTINSSASQLAKLVSSRGQSQIDEVRRAAESLSAHLSLEKALKNISAKRLIVVPDGALHQIPLSMLPAVTTKDADYKPLIEDYEIVYLPSATTLAAQRESRPRKAVSHGLSLVADPIMGPDDPRLADRPDETCPTTAALPRLQQTSEEAEAIASLTSEDSQIYRGFQATKDLVLGGALRESKYIHFATHGVIDTENPANTGLALSCYSPSGDTLDNLLRPDELDDMNLQAQLVVLSACQTGKGEFLFGEGVMGLTRGFMNAGAPRVIASLWTVQDSVARELMTDFYKRVLQDGQRPAAALRDAKLTIRKYRPDPYHWAAFVFQGEWQ